LRLWVRWLFPDTADLYVFFFISMNLLFI
jgi:hypothetical protein